MSGSGPESGKADSGQRPALRWWWWWGDTFEDNGVPRGGSLRPESCRAVGARGYSPPWKRLARRLRSATWGPPLPASCAGSALPGSPRASSNCFSDSWCFLLHNRLRLTGLPSARLLWPRLSLRTEVKSPRPPPALPAAAPSWPTYIPLWGLLAPVFLAPRSTCWLDPRNTAHGPQLLSILVQAAVTSHVTAEPFY